MADIMRSFCKTIIIDCHRESGAVQKVKSPLKTKNHKHRYINVSNTLMGASIIRKNDLLDTPFFGFQWKTAFSFLSILLIERSASLKTISLSSVFIFLFSIIISPFIMVVSTLSLEAE